MMLRTYRFATRLAGRWPTAGGTAGTALAGRRAAGDRWVAWASRHRTEGPLVWIHGASVGEILTAAPVARRLRSALPTLQIVRSFSSPSACGWPAPFHADHADYVPLDLPGPVSRVLKAAAPSLLVLARGDIWPELMLQASQLHVPVVLLGGSVRPASIRLRAPLRRWYARLLRTIAWAGAATEADAERLARLGVPPDRLEVTGDPRHDEVLERIADLTAMRELREWALDSPTLVAGSVEPEDEALVLGAAATVLAAKPTARVLVVPHVPDDAATARLLERARRLGIEAAAWTPESEAPSRARCLIVHARGLLSDLYALGTVAYVGGGFRKRQLHATIEPAAYGLPVVVGPHWQSSPDAAALMTAEGLHVLSDRAAQVALARVWSRCIEDRKMALKTGLAARSVLAHGAAAASAHRLLEFLDADHRASLRGAPTVRRPPPRTSPSSAPRSQP